MPAKYPCGICTKPVAKSHKAILCDKCGKWIHKKCNNTSNEEYIRIQETNKPWTCQKCFNDDVPFSVISDEDLKCTIQGKNQFLIPSLDPESNLNIDFFRNIKEVLNKNDGEANSNCAYYTISELNDCKVDKHFTSFFHFNIASLNLHKDELKILLDDCKHKFTCIGITETGLKNDKSNVGQFDDYEHVDCFTKTAKGGARIYVAKEVNFKERKDLKIQRKGEIEAVFTEILNEHSENIIVGCIYKHPSMNLKLFNSMYQNLTEKITSENKQLIVMGDFNIDLLKCENFSDNEDFLAQNLANGLKPFIEIPTRITAHSKTLIDNIFSNSSGKFKAGNIIASISDHLPQFLFLDLAVTKNKITETKRGRDF